LQVAEHGACEGVDLDEAALELAGEDRVAPVDAEVAVVDAGVGGDV
jgi:hypothetical protein